MDSKVYSIPGLFEVRRVFAPEGCERAHTHSDITITAVTGGNLLLKTNKETITLDKNVTAIIFPEQQHYSNCAPQGPESVYVLYSKKYSNELFPDCFQVKSTIDKELYNDFISLCDLLLDSCSDEKKNKAYINFIENILPEKLRGDKSECQDREINQLAESIKKILDNYYGERAPLDELSDAFNRSKTHCNRVFKATYNMSIQAYYLNLKAHRAKNLLGENSINLGEIALESGFYDQSHFTRIFKDIFQMTPEEYRKAMKK